MPTAFEARQGFSIDVEAFGQLRLGQPKRMPPVCDVPGEAGSQRTTARPSSACFLFVVDNHISRLKGHQIWLPSTLCYDRIRSVDTWHDTLCCVNTFGRYTRKE